MLGRSLGQRRGKVLKGTKAGKNYRELMAVEEKIMFEGTVP